MTDAYNPTVQYYVATAEQFWGLPEENKKNLLPYCIQPIDLALYGMDITNGEFITVQGEEKNRKTTLTNNLVVNAQEWLSDRGHSATDRPLHVIDSLESGNKPRKIFNTLVSMLASRYLIEQGHEPNHTLPCKLCSVHGVSSPCRELVLHHKYLLFNKRTPPQQQAIKWALGRMNSWNLHIYGPNPLEGDTRNLEASVRGAESRWRKLIKQYGKVVFVADHLQQYIVPGARDDYSKIIEVVPAQSDVVAQHGAVVISLSQVSLTSAREAASGQGKFTAAGGRKAAQESNTIFSCSYQSGSGKMAITLEDARDSGTFSVWQMLEETSGCFYGEAKRVNKLEFRPGMAQQNNGGSNGSQRR